MESIQSKLSKAAFRSVRLNKMWKLTGTELREYIDKKQLRDSHKPPRKIEEKFHISKEEMNGYCYYVMKPQNAMGQKHIFYLHGEGININYYEYPSMIHVWPLFFFRESKRATEEIIEIINLDHVPRLSKVSYRK